MARISDITGEVAQGDVPGILLKVILGALIFKLVVAVILPLGVDEAYAVAVSREYSLSFFDHPPISFWMPVIFADLSGLEDKLIYRLPFLIAGVATTAVMYLTGRELGGQRAGLWTALLYAMAPFFLVSAGILAVPDGTLSLGLAVAGLFLVKIAKSEGTPPLVWWVWTGLALAFALGSKYQAAWLPVGVLIYMLASRRGRRWFLQPGPWIGAAIGLVGLFPVVWWNMQHDWISFSFHSSRASGGFSLKNIGFMTAGQALFLLPPTLIVAVLALVQAFRRPIRDERLLLALVALGPLVFFGYVYLVSSRSHAHWTMPGWQFAFPLAGLWLAECSSRIARRFLAWSAGFLVLIWLPLVALVIHADTGFLTRWFYDRPPDWDYTLSMFDYGDLRHQLDARGLWNETDLFMAGSWAPAGHLDTALQGIKPMRIFHAGGAHHFAFLSDAHATGRALFMQPGVIRDAETTDALLLQQARMLDANAELLAPIILKRGGQDYVRISLVRLRIN